MALLLLTGYLLLFSGLIWRHSYFVNSGIDRRLLIGLLFVKVVVGVLYGVIHQYYFLGGDTWLFFEESKRIAATFWTYPDYYWQSLTGGTPAVPADEQIFTYPPSHIFWRDLGTYVVIHFNAMLIPLSQGVYEVHIVFMAMLSLIAGVNLYKVFTRYLQMPVPMRFLGCFLLPSLLFWTAGVHKDVLLFWAVSVVFSALVTRRWAWLIAGLLAVGVVRHYALALLLPAFVVYAWASIAPKNFGLRLVAFSLVGLAAVLFADAFVLDSRILHALMSKQQAFLNEMGDSRIGYITEFSDSWTLLMQLPKGALNVFARPMLWTSSGWLQWFAAVETLLILFFLALSVLLPRRSAEKSPFFYFLLVFSLGYLLLIGLLVGNEGTIVRYRAVPISFVVLLAWHCTDFARLTQGWARLRQTFSANNNRDLRTYP